MFATPDAINKWLATQFK